mgnify:CR=1 FL=1
MGLIIKTIKSGAYKCAWFFKEEIGTFSDSKEKAMLTNTAKLMQVNLTKGMENVQKYKAQINKSENFDITKALVLLNGVKVNYEKM